MRQWRFNAIEEVNEKEVFVYIQEAIANEKLGKFIKPTTKKRVTSSEFQQELDSNVTLAEAFQQFSPAKQREFHEYIDEAKREQTKLSRIEKIKPLIIQKIGLNDKYK